MLQRNAEKAAILQRNVRNGTLVVVSRDTVRALRVDGG